MPAFYLHFFRLITAVVLLLFCQLTLQALKHPFPFLSPGTALATDGGGDSGGVGTAKSTVKTLSLNDFLTRSRFQHKQLRTLNERKDTQVVITGFPKWATRSLLEAIINDSRRIKGLFKALSGVSEDTKRQDIIKSALAKARAKEALLKKDVRTTERQINEENRKIEKARTGGILPKPFVKTKRLIALQKILAAQRLRWERAEHVTYFIQTWLSHPHWGR